MNAVPIKCKLKQVARLLTGASIVFAGSTIGVIAICGVLIK
jgi:hypothetical protein